MGPCPAAGREQRGHFADPHQLYLVIGLAIHELEAATMAKQRADVVTGANTKGPREQSRSP
jgi:hypothetical protein